MENEINQAKSGEMPKPKTFNYSVYYRATPLFMNDLKITLADVAYVDANKFISEVESRQGVFPAAPLNEFIRKLGLLPYKYVNSIMAAIANDALFAKYFERLSKEEIEKIEKSNPRC